MKKRDREIAKGRIQGDSLREIGEKHGISKQRVCQILQRLEPELKAALERSGYGLDKALTKMIEMTDAELTEEHYFQKDGQVIDERIVRKADNGTRERARELLLRLNVGNLDNRRLEVTGVDGTPIQFVQHTVRFGDGDRDR